MPSRLQTELGWVDSVSSSGKQQRLAPAISTSLGIPAGCSWAECQPQVYLSRALGWFISLQGSHFGILLLNPSSLPCPLLSPTSGWTLPKLSPPC